MSTWLHERLARVSLVLVIVFVKSSSARLVKHGSRHLRMDPITEIQEDDPWDISPDCETCSTFPSLRGFFGRLGGAVPFAIG